MKRNFLAVLMGLIVVLMSAQLYGAAGYRWAVLYPASAYANADSTGALTLAEAANWFAHRQDAVSNEYSAMRMRCFVLKEDADIDSIHVVTRIGDNLTGYVVDSSEITGSTALSAMSKIYTADSVYWFGKNLITYGKIYGDAAGTAVQTITLKLVWDYWNKITGEWLLWREYELAIPFQE